MRGKDREILRKEIIDIFNEGVKAVEPILAVKNSIKKEGDILITPNKNYDLNTFQKIIIIGGGKAGSPMARALEDILEDRVDGGWVNVKYGHLHEVKKVKIHEAGHPIPDEEGIKGTTEIVKLLSDLKENDLVFVVISGGGSALLPMPADGITLEEKQATTKVLLECGATIDEINSIRKHLSKIKGGGLMRLAYPANVISLILSDVVGDPLDIIASGPTVPDTSTFKDCMEIIKKYDIEKKIPYTVLKRIEKGEYHGEKHF